MSAISAQSGGWMSGALHSMWKSISSKVKDVNERERKMKQEKAEARYEELQREHRRAERQRTSNLHPDNAASNDPTKPTKLPIQETDRTTARY